MSLEVRSFDVGDTICCNSVEDFEKTKRMFEECNYKMKVTDDWKLEVVEVPRQSTNPYLNMYLDFRKHIETLFWDKFIKSPNTKLLTIEHEEKPIGFIIVEKNVYINAMWIAPEYRRQGFGKKLVYKYLNLYSIPLYLDVLNNNYNALNFWNSIFKLEVEEKNEFDTRYFISGLKNN